MYEVAWSPKKQQWRVEESPVWLWPILPVLYRVDRLMLEVSTKDIHRCDDRGSSIIYTVNPPMRTSGLPLHSQGAGNLQVLSTQQILLSNRHPVSTWMRRDGSWLLTFFSRRDTNGSRSMSRWLASIIDVSAYEFKLQWDASIASSLCTLRNKKDIDT